MLWQQLDGTLRLAREAHVDFEWLNRVPDDEFPWNNVDGSHCLELHLSVFQKWSECTPEDLTGCIDEFNAWGAAQARRYTARALPGRIPGYPYIWVTAQLSTSNEGE